jgi:type IV secretory pathway VirB10-like protein
MQVSCSPNQRFFMEYSKIVAVTGMPGLYELISSKTDGAVVRSLADKTSHFVSGRIHRLSNLETIEVFTIGDNVNLVEIFNAMEISTEPMPDEKDAAAVKNYFQKVYPQMDFDKVYYSDMKKMIRWFRELKKNNIEIKLTPPPPEEPEVTVPPPPPPPAVPEEKTPEKKKPSREDKPAKKEEKKTTVKKESKQKETKEPQKSAAKPPKETKEKKEDKKKKPSASKKEEKAAKKKK